MFEKVLTLVAVIQKDTPQIKEIWNAFTDVFGGYLGGLQLAEPCDPAAVAKLKACCEEKLAADGPVGGIFPGDGSVLKGIIQLIITLIPLFLAKQPEQA